MIDVRIGDTIDFSGDEISSKPRGPRGAVVVDVGSDYITYKMNSSGLLRTASYRRVKPKFRINQIVSFKENLAGLRPRYGTVIRVNYNQGKPVYELEAGPYNYSGISEESLRMLTSEEAGQ